MGEGVVGGVEVVQRDVFFFFRVDVSFWFFPGYIIGVGSGKECMTEKGMF